MQDRHHEDIVAIRNRLDELAENQRSQMDTLLGEPHNDLLEGKEGSSLFGDPLTARSEADKENVQILDSDNRNDSPLDL